MTTKRPLINFSKPEKLKLPILSSALSNLKNKFAMKTSIILILFTLISLPAIAQQQFSLEQCYDLAKKHHPLGLQKADMDKIAVINRQITSTAWYPQMALNAQATYQSEVIEIKIPMPGFDFDGPTQDQYRFTLDVNQTIWDGGTTRYRQQLNDISHQAELQQLEVELYPVHEQVNRYFFQHFLLLENHQILRIAMEEIKANLAKVRSAVTNGTLLPSAQWALDVEILKMEQSLDELVSLSAANRDALSILIGEAVDPDGLVLEEPTQKLTNGINRPELALFSLQQKTLSSASLLASTARMPRVSVFAQGGYGKPGLNMLNNDFDFYYMAGIRLTWNVWDWQKTSRQRQINTLKGNMIEARKQSFEQNINLAGSLLAEKINQLKSTLIKDQEIIELQEKMVATASSQLENGTITSTDYIVQVNALTRARVTFQTHKIQLSQSITQFNTLTGN
jgi:outer membrane protein TolC